MQLIQERFSFGFENFFDAYSLRPTGKKKFSKLEEKILEGAHCLSKTRVKISENPLTSISNNINKEDIEKLGSILHAEQSPNPSMATLRRVRRID